MKLLFISYWSVCEPLTSSTILPYLRMMSVHPNISEVTFVTVEREGPDHLAALGTIPGVRHMPVRARFQWAGPLSKIDLFVRIILKLSHFVKRENVDLIDAKAALAGAIAHLVSKVTGVPYMVESFEPHSEYMAGCGVWSRSGLYYRVSHWLERAQKLHARLLITVTQNYRNELIGNGLSKERVKVIPSIVDTVQFAFDQVEHDRIRASLGWPQNATVGVYMGKFGGLYYDEETYIIFKKALDLFGDDFRLIILSIDRHDGIEKRLIESGFPLEKVCIRTAEHSEVPGWLSAADVAFSPIRFMAAGMYQSPVKNGEYWASGLPILLTNKVSDDHRLIQNDPCLGALFDVDDLASVDRALHHVHQMLREGVPRDHIMARAVEYRSIRIAEEVYAITFGAGQLGIDSK